MLTECLEGQSVRVLEDDDGSGWVKVGDASGGNGLVPASYIELVTDEPTPVQAPPAFPTINRSTKPQLGVKKKYGKFSPYCCAS